MISIPQRAPTLDLQLTAATAKLNRKLAVVYVAALHLSPADWERAKEELEDLVYTAERRTLFGVEIVVSRAVPDGFFAMLNSDGSVQIGRLG